MNRGSGAHPRERQPRMDKGSGVHAAQRQPRMDQRRTVMSDTYPEDLKYTEEHEWARIEGDRAVVGITHYAQDALGDIVYVDLPPVGTTVAAGETFGEVESTKSVSDIYSPLSGTIAERNEQLDKSPEII